jgi:hypothetical protein
MVLRAASEGTAAGYIDFFSTRAPLAVQPRLKITYMARPEPGLP